MNIPREVARRFWKKVRRTRRGCKLWMAGKDRDGYGRFNLPRELAISLNLPRPIRAHRLAFFLTGRRIPDGKILGHFPFCHNPSCVIHIRPITYSENRREAIR